MQMVTDVRELFDPRWVCGVTRSGRHNGSGCTPSEPHSGWGCEYRWVAPDLTDAEAALLGLR